MNAPRMAHATGTSYQMPFWNPEDDLFRRCLTASAAAGLVLLLIVMLVPLRHVAITSVDQLPPRYAKIVLEKPKKIEKPRPAVDDGPSPVVVEPQQLRKPDPPPSVGARTSAPKPLDPAAGQAGRERAQAEVATRLASATASIEKTLGGLDASLNATSDAPVMPGRGGRARSVRGGRGGGEIGAVAADVGSGGSADVGGSAVQGSYVSVGRLSTGGGGGSSDAAVDGGASTGGRSTGAYRSNASLLAVIQKYQAGIQYCYGNELKRSPGLSGKLVVAITVAASGEVSDVTIVQNSLGSERIASCALSQIKDWKFPAISGGATTFQAPFVFTPPN